MKRNTILTGVISLFCLVFQSNQATASWPLNDLPVCTQNGDQQIGWHMAYGSDAYIIIWYDYRSGDADIYAQKATVTDGAVWQPDGVQVCGATGNQIVPRAASDGAGGVIIVWPDDRNGGFDIYAQRVDSNGNVLWTTDGVPVCVASGDQYRVRLIDDGAGGAVVAWDDTRGGDRDIYAQRIDANGAVQWNTNGNLISAGPADQTYLRITRQGDDAVVIAWQDNRSADNDIYAQRVSLDGVNAWTAGVSCTRSIPCCPAIS